MRMNTRFNSDIGSNPNDPLSSILRPTLQKADDDANEPSRTFVSIPELLRCADGDFDRRLVEIMSEVEKERIYRLDRFGRIIPTDPAPVLKALE